jgi:hypothetical protein
VAGGAVLRDHVPGRQRLTDLPGARLQSPPPSVVVSMSDLVPDSLWERWRRCCRIRRGVGGSRGRKPIDDRVAARTANGGWCTATPTTLRSIKARRRVWRREAVRSTLRDLIATGNEYAANRLANSIAKPGDHRPARPGRHRRHARRPAGHAARRAGRHRRTAIGGTPGELIRSSRTGPSAWQPHGSLS